MSNTTNTNDKYEDFSTSTFNYDYPYTWKKRNKEYLKKRENRSDKHQTSSYRVEVIIDE